MNNLFETLSQKLVLLIGGVSIFFVLADTSTRYLGIDLAKSLGIAVLTLVLLVVLKGYEPKSPQILQKIVVAIKRHWKTITLVLLALALVWGVVEYVQYLEIKSERERLEIAEGLYQQCLDKAVLERATLRYVHLFNFGDFKKGDVSYREGNPYIQGWSDANRPLFNDRTGHWEWSFIAWLIQNHPDVCEEFDIGQIRYFLEIKGTTIGINYFSI